VAADACAVCGGSFGSAVTMRIRLVSGEVVCSVSCEDRTKMARAIPQKPDPVSSDSLVPSHGTPAHKSDLGTRGSGEGRAG
jgi:hypothetical protein